MDLKNIVKGDAELLHMKAGGIAQYKLTDLDGNCYLLDIDLSDKNDVGESAVFDTYYSKSLILMRWIRRAIDDDTLVEL